MAIRIVTDGKTITTATRFEVTTRISAGGSFSFALPAASAEAGYVAVLEEVACYWDHIEIAQGYIKDFAIAGETMTVRCDDMAFELAGTTISAAASGLMDAADAIDWVGTLLPGGWTLDNDVAGSAEVYVSEVVRESILATLGAICTAAGLWFVIDGKTLTVADAFGPVRYGVEVLEIAKAVDSNEIVTKIYPYGAGNKDAAVALQPSTTTVGGYTINKSANSVTDAGSSYPLREREVQFPKITPREATEAALVEAANGLVLAAVEYLRKHASPLESYAVTCYYAGKILPLERVALNVKTDALLVNATPVVVESRMSIDTSGLVTTQLTLEIDGRRIPTDAQVVAGAIITAHANAVYPAPQVENPSASAHEHITRTGDAIALPWALSERTVQIRSANLTANVTDTGVVPGMSPSGLQYRLNGAGSWSTLSGTVDLLAALADPDTGFPLALAGTVNVRATGVAELIADVGASWSGLAAIPSGTKVLILSPTTYYNSATNLAGLTPNGTIPAGTVVTITSASPTDINPYDTNRTARWYGCNYAAFAWLRVYVKDNFTNLLVEALDGQTSAFDSDIDAALAIGAVTI